MAPTGLVASFVAAIQASLSVLLVIFYGGVAAWLNLLSSSNTKAISKVCVRLFLPALLFTKIGSELHSGSAHRYVVILAWAAVCHVVSFAVGIGAHLLLRMPDWTTVAVMFNNTTSYPLLLMAALDQTGILQSLVGADETTRAALERAKSYFLVFSTVSSCLTFAVGPRLIDTEHAPEPDSEGSRGDDDGDGKLLVSSESSSADVPEEPAYGTSDRSASAAGLASRLRSERGYDPLLAAPLVSDVSEETGLLAASRSSSQSAGVRFVDPFASSNSFFPSTRAQSKSQTQAQTSAVLYRRVSIVPKKQWVQLGPRTKWWLLFVADFFNAPMLGALAGAVIGLTPALHRAFFSSVSDGGIFTAWLTASLDDIGGLFVPLPVVVAGVSLYTAMQTARRNSSSGPTNTLPWPTVAFILVVRFVLWPLASIYTIWALASHTTLLGDDPMLWFALMLMPTGPPAMKLITLVQVSDADADDETSIAKLLTISYLISPILSFTVVGSLRASQAVMGA